MEIVFKNGWMPCIDADLGQPNFFIHFELNGPDYMFALNLRRHIQEDIKERLFFSSTNNSIMAS